MKIHKDPRKDFYIRYVMRELVVYIEEELIYADGHVNEKRLCDIIVKETLLN